MRQKLSSGSMSILMFHNNVSIVECWRSSRESGCQTDDIVDFVVPVGTREGLCSSGAFEGRILR